MTFGRNKEDANPFGEARPAAASAPESNEFSRLRTAARLDLFFTLLFIVLVVAGTYVGISRAEQKNLDDPIQKATRGEVVGAEGLSMVKPENFKKALDLVQARLKPDEVLISLRLAPGGLNLTVRDTEGDQRYFGVPLDYKVDVSSSGESSSEGELGLSRVDADAPARFLNAMLARAKFDAKKLDYFSYDPADEGDPADWTAYFEDVPIKLKNWTANAKGEYVRLPGEPNPEDEAASNAESAREPTGDTDPQYVHYTARKDGESYSYQGPEALEVIRCVRAAGTDTETILGCIK